MDPLIVQIEAFSYTILAGIVAGVCFDIYRAARSVRRCGNVGTWINDFLFWLILIPVIFILLLRSNWAELRLYVFLGNAMGILLYFGVFSPWMFAFFRYMFRGGASIAAAVFFGFGQIISVPAYLISEARLRFGLQGGSRSRGFRPNLLWRK